MGLAIIRSLCRVIRARIPSLEQSHGGIPKARRIVVPDAGHLIYLEKPEEFSRIVIDFLEAHHETQ